MSEFWSRFWSIPSKSFWTHWMAGMTGLLIGWIICFYAVNGKFVKWEKQAVQRGHGTWVEHRGPGYVQKEFRWKQEPVKGQVGP